MKTYEVTYTASVRHIVTVYAKSEEEAVDISWDKIWEVNRNDNVSVSDWDFDLIEEID